MDKDLFGLYYVIYDDVIKGMEQKKYAYIDTENFIQNYVEQLGNGDIRESQKIYWMEILLRVHFTAVTSVIRAKKWLYGVLVGVESGNLMIFSASLRGYLESVVDTYYSLESIPCGLALNYKKIKMAIDGKMNYMFMKLIVSFDEQQLTEEEIEKCIHKSLNGVKIIEKNNNHFEDLYVEEETNVFKRILLNRRKK